jgi:hypothetical protein
VVNDKNMVERRSVREGPPKGTMRVVAEGLSGDERVVVKGLLKAAPGRPVTPEEEDPGQQSAEAPEGQKPAY